VYVAVQGTFVLYGGKIFNNTIGGVVSYGGFSMYGGEIYNP
jgi:hypothetical protein